MLSASKLAEQMKVEILADVESGRVPATVANFSELHNYVDANCYGGTEQLFEEYVTESATDQEHQVKLDKLNDVMAPAMDIVDQWIKAGALPRALFHMGNGMNAENAIFQSSIEAPLGFSSRPERN